MSGKEKSGEQEIKPIPRWPLFVAAFFVTGLWMFNWVWQGGGTVDRGTFGDMFGWVNSLFSGLALLGLVYAIVQQNQQIKINQRELAETKRIFEEQSKSLVLQNEVSYRSIFEQTFFQILNIFINTADGLSLQCNYDGKYKIPTGDGMLNFTSGRQSFSDLLEGILPVIDEAGVLDFIENQYDDFYAEYSNQVGHYFSILHTLLTYVHESTISNKDIYFRIIASHLSDAEREFLAYHGLSKYEDEDFKSLIEKYGLLRGSDIPIKQPKLAELYKRSAFY